MLLRLKSQKSALSTWLVGIFFIFLMASALISEFFQAPAPSHHQLGEYQTVLKSSELSNVQEITIKNRLGSFTLKKDAQASWQLTSPREYPATVSTMDQIFTALAALKIKNIYEKDQINTGNFSLDRPQLEISFVNEDQSTQVLQVGLVNPIDNSTYLSLDKGKAIYHVDALTYPFEKLDIALLIDTRIFSMNMKSIASFTLYRSKISDSNLQLEFHRNGNNWETKDNKVLEPQKVEEYLGEILALKSQVILDRQTPALQEKVNELLSSAYYVIKIVDTQQNEYIYNVTWPVNALPDIKMEKRENFLISATDRKHPFLIHKDNFALFQKRQAHFRALSIKKLFY